MLAQEIVTIYLVRKKINLAGLGRGVSVVDGFLEGTKFVSVQLSVSHVANYISFDFLVNCISDLVG